MVNCCECLLAVWRIITSPFYLCYWCLNKIYGRDDNQSQTRILRTQTSNYEALGNTEPMIPDNRSPTLQSSEHQGARPRTNPRPQHQTRTKSGRRHQTRRDPVPQSETLPRHSTLVDETLLLEQAVPFIFDNPTDGPIDIHAEIVAAHFFGSGLDQQLHEPGQVSTIEIPFNAQDQASANDPIPQQNVECPICLINPKDRIMVPCGHCFCDSCSKRIEMCAICRRPIQQKTAIRLINLDEEIRAAAMADVLSDSPSISVAANLLTQSAHDGQDPAGPDPECSNCYRRPKSVIMIPCGHGFCKPCSSVMDLKCVLCKLIIRSKNVYHFDV
jgi:Zinc finger, C3HC4 type (RING finger)